MGLLLLSFLGGILTIASPCVLPMLPVIVGSISASSGKKKPLLTVASLSISIVLFTLLLKWSTVLLNVPSSIWPTLSGAIVVLLGISFVFPQLWTWLMLAVRIQRRSEEALQRSSTIRSSWLQPILAGAALGPVFSSCSPTYFFILATVLPQTFAVGLLNLIVYAVGLSSTLLIIALLGRRATQRLKFASNPYGKFRRGLGVLLVLIGILILTGVDKKIETALVNKGLSATGIESTILDYFTSNTKNTTQSVKSSTVAMNIKNPKVAPELRGLNYWINSTPLTLASLKGKVVLIDFWTYSCINCIRTLPTLKSWYQEYSDDGFVIIGVHAPEFAFEHVPANVQKAIDEYGITYPVALDNDFSTWRAYNNRYWPAKYFIDREGKLRHTHFGEGDDAESEAVIRQLLTEDSSITLSNTPVSTDTVVPVRQTQTPETYLGYARADLFDNEREHVKDIITTYSLNAAPKNNHWGLDGAWTSSQEKVTSEDNESTLTLRFSAKSVYLVIAPNTSADLALKLNGVAVTQTQAGIDVSGDTLHVEANRLYHLIELPEFTSDQLLEITVPKGASLHAFTFGS